MPISGATDDDLTSTSQEQRELDKKSEFVREPLKASVATQAARKLARLGGTIPDAEAVPRRRFR
jgi:Arc/MetJ family transcription regulator